MPLLADHPDFLPHSRLSQNLTAFWPGSRDPADAPAPALKEAQPKRENPRKTLSAFFQARTFESLTAYSIRQFKEVAV